MNIQSKYMLFSMIFIYCWIVRFHKLYVYHWVMVVYLTILEICCYNFSVINYDNVIVKLSALGSSVKPEGKVHSYVVNALCKLFFNKKRLRESYKHYFFTKVGVSAKWNLLIICILRNIEYWIILLAIYIPFVFVGLFIWKL